MLAFLGPVQIAIFMAVVLVVFGPQKLPEIGQQLGRAMREIMKARQQFMDAIDLDGKLDTPYEPPRYEPYDNTYASTPTAEIAGETWSPAGSESGWQAALPSAEPPHGDFAASALSDTASDYGTSAPPALPAAPEFHLAPPSGTVPRSKE